VLEMPEEVSRNFMMPLLADLIEHLSHGLRNEVNSSKEESKRDLSRRRRAGLRLG
jgi:hypothetical protein